MNTGLEARLAAALTGVQAEIAKADGKVAGVMAFVGAVLLAVVAAAKDLRGLPTGAYVSGGAGVVLLVAAVVMLLVAVCPRLGGARPVGFPAWARMTVDEIRADLETDRTAEHIAVQSGVALAKYQAISRGMVLVLAGLGLLVVAVAIVIGGAV
ncbi:Pycsar system effector family protein [Streptomyces clavuligerus]|uniref:Pycsar effector protein domain-containing protein n=1 Tax=Streptomyces clavuligerus TaxID=1901 RepID=E2Q6K3_STRCL|nr:Pycsar system effector family protein [Streptomyces clavuligerus]ANW18108.1 hypothetical protein BB341_07665 [Streptomyces clavuligerus]AXU12669.1 hypothetical protein D1794_07955 [Streptomyces clavuligerus]EFG09302.1 Hypothetical protein SCLAV_4228 [Streptomyces clavuligerus]MBY6302572.1 hypothetical protein [Streptomyces clavuligerus]QCS05452.1 hypothetical protein CRV15_07385 [Streptomyces clavuligerus]